MRLSVFHSASPQAFTIEKLFYITLAICAVILAIVTVALVYMMIRYRQRGAAEPDQRTGNRTLEIVWTAVPILIVAALFILSVVSARAVDRPVNRPPDVIVTGHQWWWEAQYPAVNAITANEIHVAANRDTLLEIDAADVIHDFWAPRLGRKIDAVPGRHNFVQIHPDAPGTCEGACAEYCGAEHAWMRFRVIAEEDAAAYDAWLRRQAEPSIQPAAGQAALGAKRFTELTCSNCHTIRGVNPVNPFAPDLTHVGGRERLAAERIANTPENLTQWLREPDKIKPGSLMPNLKLSDSDVHALTAYLEALK